MNEVIIKFMIVYYATAFILTLMGIYGTTVGAHRLWSHKAFKANTFLRFLLMISQTMAGQVSKTFVARVVEGKVPET